jgi:hypothetical protein
MRAASRRRTFRARHVARDREERRSRAADRAPERTRIERGLFHVVEIRDQRCAARLGVAIVERAAEECAVTDRERVCERGGVRHLLDPRRAIDRFRQQRARFFRADAHVRGDERNPPVGGDRQLDDVDRIDAARQREAADDTRRDVVEMASGECRFAFERRGENVALLRCLSECERRCVRAGDARRRAAAHASGECETFVDGDDRAKAVRQQIRVRRDGRAVARGIQRHERGVAADDRIDARLFLRQRDGHTVADAVDGEAEDVEAGTDVADGAGRVCGGLVVHAERLAGFTSRDPLRRSTIVIATMSLSTPAAVTAAPAPGPVTTSGFVE